jgi:hypothetical protein
MTRQETTVIKPEAIYVRLEKRSNWSGYVPPLTIDCAIIMLIVSMIQWNECYIFLRIPLFYILKIF